MKSSMQVVHALDRRDAPLTGAAIALGNFDGLHLGHQAVIAAARAAGADKAPLGVAVFDPHPRRFFVPHAEPFRILSDAVRDRLLGEIGVAALYRIPFDRSLSLMDDRAFARDVLKDALGIAHVAVGADFRFGRDRVGTAESLKRLGDELGFGVSIVAPVGGAGSPRVSSTAIRAAIAQGDMAAAAAMMTRPWIVDGVVERGDQRGRGLGFPTANLGLGDHVRPKLGVYAVGVHVEATRAAGGFDRDGVAYIGRRPMFGGLDERLEAHLFDFDGDLYGRRIEVSVRAFVREDRMFEGVDALKAQIAEDAAAARKALAEQGPSPPGRQGAASLHRGS
jgi:riboflavin kinase/FMN adenylyltransferase